MSLRLYFVAGEASGDNHGAALMRSLGAKRSDLQSLGRGGPQMKTLAGANFIDWIDEAGVVGLWEVLKHYRYFRREMRRTLDEIAVAKPAAVVLIDYPGFNLRLARTLRERSLGGKIIYYISPQVWAWNRGRIPKMARWLDLMLCIFPFEADLYAQSGLRAVFVGHPMIETVAAAKKSDIPREPNLVGFFPGSRAREVRKLFPIMLAVMRELRAVRGDLHFEIAAASPALATIIQDELAKFGDSLGKVNIIVGRATETMQRSAAGVVASGTATLEAAVFAMPFVLVYKVAPLTYLAGRILIRVNYLGMPNVLANRAIVPEFIQHAARPAAIAREVLRLLNDAVYREKVLADFNEVVARLGHGGADEAAADAILETVGLTPNA